MDTFPIVGDKLPAKEDGGSYDGWLLFLDELTSAPPAVQSAAYKLILDRMVGNHHLHKNVAIVGAGNLEGDNAIVHSMSTALQSRLVHLEVVMDFKEWIDWASAAGVDYRITSYINFKPSALYTFKPDHVDKTYASPRTWEFESRLVKKLGLQDKDLWPLSAGTISPGVASEFLTFCKIFDELPTIDRIIDSPTSIKVPDAPDVLFALTGSIGNHANADNIAQLMKFVERMPLEFRVVCLRDIVRRTPALMSTPVVRDWISTNATKLF